MVNRVGDFLLNAVNLAFENGDAGVQFIDGQGIEILLYEQGERIAWLVRKKFVQIHEAQR